MILVTGATGFVGQRLLRRLALIPDLKIRVLMRPGSAVERLPRGMKVHVVTGDLLDPVALLTAMEGVHTVIHLAGTDTRGRFARLQNFDVAGTRAVLDAALEKRVGRFIYVSRIGADRASAFPVLRSRGEIEEMIRSSGIAFTIFQAGVLFGEGDRFSDHIAMLIRAFPVYFMPGDGDQVLQPLWVEDLVTCMVMSLNDINLLDRTVAVGGPEVLPYRRIVMRVMYAIGSSRPILSAPLLFHRVGAWYLDGLFARWPVTPYWVEMFSTAQTSELGTIERLFGFRPASFDIGLIDKYMKDRRYFREFIRYIFSQSW